jgi:adenylate cyclase
MANEAQPRLAVILHADVVGSTTLVRQDERLAHQRIQAAFRDVGSLVEHYGGTVNEVRGDALVAEFARASDAVLAALAGQGSNQSRLAGLEDGVAPVLRMGIALGEVVIADATVTGAGVVLAQRLEQLAEPGGICVSGAVREATPERLAVIYVALGDQHLKGFDEPVRAFSVSPAPGSELPHPEQSGAVPDLPRRTGRRAVAFGAALAVLGVAVMAGVAWIGGTTQENSVASTAPASVVMLETPSLAVLPFENRSDEPDRTYFAEGITDDLTTDLSKVSALFVIARESARAYSGQPIEVVSRELGVRYVLRGSVRRAGENVRINAQLVDASSGGNMWAERYDGSLADVFALQDKVTQQIVTALSVTLSDREQSALSEHYTANPDAYDLLLRGNSLVGRFAQESNLQARDLYLAALELDPGFARAHGGLALTYAYDARFAWSADPANSLAQALSAAREGVRLAPRLEQAYFALGVVSAYMRRSDDAITAARRAIELNSNYADGHALLSFGLVHAGRAREALAAIDEAIRLNPRPPGVYRMHRGRALYFLGRYDESLRALRESATINPAFVVTHLYIAAALTRLGMQDDAEWAAEEALALVPQFGVDAWAKEEIFTDAGYLEQLVSGLKDAGLPE